MRLGTTEIILIVVLALVLFGGGGKLAGVGKALGKSIKDFKHEVKEDDDNKSDEDEEEEKPAKSTKAKK